MKRILILLVLFSNLLFCENIFTIKQAIDPYPLGKKSAYFVDKNGSLSIDEILHSKFTPYSKNILNFGFISPVHWFKFQYTYTELMSRKEWWLSIDYPLLDYVTLFIYDSKGNLVANKYNGDLNQIHEVDVKQNAILFTLPHKPLEKYTLYLKVNTSSSMLLPVYIMSNEKLIQSTHFSQTLSGMYYGILLILFLYNAITFSYTREKIYVQYAFFIVAYALWQLSFDGLGILYVWGDYYWMREKATTLFIYSGTFFLLLFSQTLLNANENIPKFNKYLLQPLLYITLLGMLAAIIFPYKFTIVVGALLSMLVPTSLFIAGLMVLKKDYYSIRLFVLGWGVFLVGTILFAMSKFNLVEGYLIMKYGQQIASAIDMILLSGALVERFNRLRNEYTQKLKTHNQDLKLQVKTALAQEREKDQILIAQSRLASTGEMIEQIAHQWRQPLNNIGLINQDLYFKKHLGTVQDEDFDRFHFQVDENLSYMSKTIDDFRTYHSNTKDKETYLLNDSIGIILSILEATLKHYKIDIIINAKQEIKVHNIKNELFQVFINILNNAKDVLISNDIKDKKIFITLYEKDGFAFVDIEDNAGGISEDIIDKIFDSYFTTKEEDKGTGIGLYMSKEILEKSMSGELSVKNNKTGACFTIKLPLSD